MISISMKDQRPLKVIWEYSFDFIKHKCPLIQAICVCQENNTQDEKI